MVDKVQEENSKRYALENKKIAKESSELCEVFQKYKLSVDMKQDIIKSMLDDFKASLYVVSV